MPRDKVREPVTRSGVNLQFVHLRWGARTRSPREAVLESGPGSAFPFSSCLEPFIGVMLVVKLQPGQ